MTKLTRKTEKNVEEVIQFTINLRARVQMHKRQNRTASG